MNMFLSFVVCCWAGVDASRSPFLDLPAELAMNVNKAPHPIVNIIADQPLPSAQHVSVMRSLRSQEQGQQAAFVQQFRSVEERNAQELQKQREQLKKLLALKEVAALQQRQGAGKEAELSDVLRVAQQARQVAEAYAQEKHRASQEQASKDIYLANALTRGSLDQEVAAERSHAGVHNDCPNCVRGYLTGRRQRRYL